MNTPAWVPRAARQLGDRPLTRSDLYLCQSSGRDLVDPDPENPTAKNWANGEPVTVTRDGERRLLLRQLDGRNTVQEFVLG